MGGRRGRSESRQRLNKPITNTFIKVLMIILRLTVALILILILMVY